MRTLLSRTLLPQDRSPLPRRTRPLALTVATALVPVALMFDPGPFLFHLVRCAIGASYTCGGFWRVLYV
jgi:hypothetical protein